LMEFRNRNSDLAYDRSVGLDGEPTAGVALWYAQMAGPGTLVKRYLEILPGPDGVLDTLAPAGDDQLEYRIDEMGPTYTKVNWGANRLLETTPVDDDDKTGLWDGLLHNTLDPYNTGRMPL